MKRLIIVPIALALLLTLGKVVAFAKDTNSFQIIVDTNQIYPNEAEQASKLRADGVWAIPQNSTGVNWEQTLKDLNSDNWVISEDNPTSTSQVDFISQTLGRMVDGAMFYIEDGLATPLTDDLIEKYASHEVPGFGKVGNRIIVLTRSYNVSDVRHNQLDHALESPYVSGAAFEVTLSGGALPSLNLAEGCKYIVSLNKKCYLLMPTLSQTNPLLVVQDTVKYLDTQGILNDPNIYIVVAGYIRKDTRHFISLSDNDVFSIESAVNWLKEYRNLAPIGNHDGVNNDACRTGGWALDRDDPSASINIHIYADGPAGSGTLLGGFPANIPREDVNHVVNVSGNHGFNVTFNPSISSQSVLFDNQPHKLYVYAIDGQVGSGNRLISSSPKSIICQPNNQWDFNSDNHIDIFDYNYLLANFGNPYTISDYENLIINFGK